MGVETLSAAASAASVIGGVAVLLSGMVAVIRWSDRKLGARIAEEIRAATYAIHPDANGGLSLPDVARKTEKISQELSEVKAQVDLLVDLYKKE